jgi:hypothetical protein
MGNCFLPIYANDVSKRLLQFIRAVIGSFFVVQKKDKREIGLNKKEERSVVIASSFR